MMNKNSVLKYNKKFSKNEKKIAIIGLDGMSWPILEKLFEHRVMPALERIAGKSLKGILKSTIPPNSATAWTSIATGVNPGKHGVFGFTTFDENYRTRILSSADVCIPRIHEIIALHGMRSVGINVPLSYPIKKIEGSTIITDWLAPKLSYYPDSIEKYANNYKIQTGFLNSKKNSFFEGVYNGTVRRVNAVNDIMRDLDWDVFFVVYSEPDHIFHLYCDEILNGKDSSFKIFEKIDETILVAEKFADLIIILSDHGFAKYKYAIFVNAFLEKLGLVSKTWNKRFDDIDGLTSKKAPSTINIPDVLYRFISKEPIRSFLKNINKSILNKSVQARLSNADPSKSKAFMPFNTSFGIHVKEENLIDMIISQIKQSNYFKDCWRREEIYWGNHVNKAPEIMFLPNFNEGYSRGETSLPGKVILKRNNWWQHHPDGIIVLFDGKADEKWIGTKSAFDIVPTVLNYLDLPIPPDTDGLPIEGVSYGKES